MSERRQRYLRREAERKERAAQSTTPDANPDYDQEYAAYLESLGEDAEHLAYLESLGEQERAEWWRQEKEKITWHPNHQRDDNWHDDLVCSCRACTRYRQANGIKPFAERHPGDPDPWDSES